jgi:tRNA modification GTPase
LLNALAGQSRAVVSPQAGTTRDVLYAPVALARGIIRLADAAGLGAPSDSPLEASMQRQALREIEAADLVLLVHDLCSDEPVLSAPRPPDLLVLTKLDAVPSFPSSGTPGDVRLSEAKSRPVGSQGGGRMSNLSQRPPPLPSPGVPEEGEIAAETVPQPPVLPGTGAVAVSALTGLNMTDLRRRLDELAFGSAVAAPTLTLSARHVQAIEAAQQALQRAVVAVDAAEILSLELREALDALGSILGRLTTEDLLGRIFASFCIGK